MLTARGSTFEAGFRYGVVRQLFEPALADPAAQSAHSRARRRRRARSSRSPPTAMSDPLDGFATLHGLYWLILNLAGDDPLLLAIDDLHWVDHPSLRFISYLTRASRASR